MFMALLFVVVVVFKTRRDKKEKFKSEYSEYKVINLFTLCETFSVFNKSVHNKKRHKSIKTKVILISTKNVTSMKVISSKETQSRLESLETSLVGGKGQIHLFILSK